MQEGNPAAEAHPGPDDMHIGDADRTEATRLLGEHFQAGRLQAEEYGQRTQTAVIARTRGELRALFRDLPGPWPSTLRPWGPSPGYHPVPVVPGVPVLHTSPYVSDKSKVVAGVLQILLPFGVGRFYTGNTAIAVAQLITAFCGVGAIWSMIDGIVILVGGARDGHGRPIRN